MGSAADVYQCTLLMLLFSVAPLKITKKSIREALRIIVMQVCLWYWGYLFNQKNCNCFRLLLAKQHLEGRMIGAFLDISMQRRFLCGADPDFYLVYLIVRLILPPVQYIIWTFRLWFSSNHLLKCGFVWKHCKGNINHSLNDVDLLPFTAIRG